MAEQEKLLREKHYVLPWIADTDAGTTQKQHKQLLFWDNFLELDSLSCHLKIPVLTHIVQ